MLKLRLPKLVALGIFALGIFSTAYADITPLRTGPVSQYGMLMTGINSQNEGRVYGSCNAYSNASGNEVQVKGMSLFWSNEKNQNRFWRNDVITGMVSQQGIQVIRAAMAVDDQGWGNGHYFINGKTEYYQDLLDETVQAAIEQDIYVIIDYHSHTAVDNVGRAKEFFKIQAKKWGSYPNVIFEIYNEPICKAGQGHGNSSNCTMITWPEIKAYANEVIPIIRRYSNNLIVVGTPSWSGNPGAVVGNAITGYDNIAYTFHYYAGKNDGTEAHDFNSMSADVNSALGAGLSVFVTEWGTVGYGGDGAPSMANNPQWQTWMNLKKLSSANWNAGRNMTKDGAENSEYFADFDVDNTSPANWTYSASGEWVNANVFNGLSAMTYSQCASYVDLPAVPADDPDFDDSGDDFGDNIYEDEVISHDYVIVDFDMNNLGGGNYSYVYSSLDDPNGDWTWYIGNDGEKTFFVDGSNAGGLVKVFANDGAGWAGFGIYLKEMKGCEVLSFKYKGLANDFSFNAGSSVLIQESLIGTESWMTQSISLDGIDPVVLESPLELKWQVSGSPSGGDLYIDDVVCGEPSSSSSGDEPASSGSFEEYALSPNYDYAYAGNGWTIENPQNEGNIAATVYDDEMGGDFWGLKNVNTEEEGGYAGVGMNISNLNGCQVLSYQYIGIGHNLTFANTPDGEDVLAEWEIPSSNTWTTHTFNMSSLSGINLERELDIKWQVPGGENGNLYVKEIQCVLDGGSSSSSVGEESSSSVELPIVAEPTTNTELFDDFEDGDYYPLWDGIGQWWAETDVVGGGGSSNAELSFVKGSASAKALQMSYSLDVGDYPWGPPYATISTNDFNEMNLSQCSEVRYDYKGAAHKFRLKVSSDMNNLLDMGWGFPTFAVTSPSESWQTVTIPVASLRQEWTGSSDNWVDVETVLQYANGFDWRVDGEDTDDKSSGTLAIDNIRCVGLAETQYYRITFMNGTEPYEAKDWAAGSNVPDPEGTPVKAPDAQYTYTFSNWTYGYGNPTRYVTGTATYEAVYNSVLRAYTVTFLMDDGTPVENGVLEGVEYGTLVSSIVPADPTKESTAEYSYAFTGWSPDIADATVTGDIDYTAVFSENKNKYAVTFVDEDESILKAAVEYDYGTLPGAIDVPTVEDKNGKKFAGWEPGLATVTKEVTYKAVYTDKIVITWKDDDGSVLRQDYVDDGDMPDYGEAPAKETTAEFTYTFDKWTPTVVAATEDATYTASYTSVKNKYDVTFVAEYNSNMDKTVSVEYGTLVNSVAPLITGAWTIEWTYEFDGWVPAITDEAIVTGEATYTAKYKVTKNRYTVTFVMDDGIEKAADDVTVDYGTSIASIIPSTDPVKQATVARTYEFDRWVVNVSDTQDRELVNGEVLEGNMTLKAVFKEFPRKYGITFLNEDNSVYKAQVLYEYGTLASEILPEENPTKDSDDKFSYTFANWDPQVTDVTGEAVYRPVFTSTALVPESSSSSAEGPESSSSEEPESSSAEVAESSSSEESAVSSSSETVVASSSSEKPVSSSSTEIAANSSSSISAPLSSSRNDDEKSSSSSADKPKSSASEDDSSSSSDAKSSSSGKTDGLYPTVGSVNMVFAHNELTVTVPKASEVKVHVFDMQGHLQEHYLGYSAGDHVVSLRHLNKGVYIVRVASGNAVKTQRIMIK